MEVDPMEFGSVAPMMKLGVPIIYRVVAVSAACSALGSLFIIITWFLFRELRFLGRKLIVFISVADLITSATFVLSVNGTGAMGGYSLSCVIQAYLLEFFALASYLWTACFAFHLYQLICRENTEPAKYEKFYHAVSWGLPFLFDGILFVRRKMGARSMGGTERPWCWITDGLTRGHVWTEGTLEQFVFFYLPLLFIFLWNLSLYVVLGRRVSGSDMGSTIQKRLKLYLVVFLLCAVWGLAHRVYQMASADHEPNIYLSYLEAGFGPLQGFLNALVYGVNSQVIRRYGLLCQRCFRCCRRRRCCGGAAEDGEGDEDDEEDATLEGMTEDASSMDTRTAANAPLPPSTRTGPFATGFRRVAPVVPARSAHPASGHGVDGMDASRASYVAYQERPAKRGPVAVPPPATTLPRFTDDGWPVAEVQGVPASAAHDSRVATPPRSAEHGDNSFSINGLHQ